MSKICLLLKRIIRQSEWAPGILVIFHLPRLVACRRVDTTFLGTSFLLRSINVSGSVISRRVKSQLPWKCMSDRQHIIVTSFWFSLHLLITIQNRLHVIVHWGISLDKMWGFQKISCFLRFKKKPASFVNCLNIKQDILWELLWKICEKNIFNLILLFSDYKRNTFSLLKLKKKHQLAKTIHSEWNS